MNKDMYKTLPDRILIYVKKDEINSDDIDKYPVGYADDARPVRFVEYSTQPSGEYAVFEAGGKFPIHVKRLELNPALIKSMFQDIWDKTVPTGLMTLSQSPLTLNTELEKVARQWAKAVERDDIPTMAQALKSLLFLRKSWIPVNSLPAEVITGQIKVNKESIPENPTQETKQLGESKFPWLWIAVAAAVGIAVVSSNGSEK
jgi:hypothetical protein